MKRGLLMLALALAFACEKEKPSAPTDPAVFEIYDKAAPPPAAPVLQIKESEVRLELARTRVGREGNLRASPLPAPVKDVVLKRYVDRRLLLLEAERLSVKVSTAAVAKEIAAAERGVSARGLRQRLIETYQTKSDYARSIEERLRIGQLLRKAAHADQAVSEAEIDAAWREIPAEDKTLPDLVQASQILVRTQEEGKEMLSQLKRGADFAELAAKHSQSPEAERGGDLGWFERGVMPQVFDETCFSLKPGQVSPLVPSEYGFHIFKVLAVEAGRELGLEEMKERLRSKILHKKLENAEIEYLDKLRGRYDIRRDDKALAAIE